MYQGGGFSGLATGLQWLGGGAGLYAIARILAVLLPFLAGRLDARTRRLDEQQARLDERYDARLRNLEGIETKMSARVGQLEEAVNILTGALRELDPRNEALSEVARILRKAVPLPHHTPQDMIDKLKGVE